VRHVGQGLGDRHGVAIELTWHVSIEVEGPELRVTVMQGKGEHRSKAGVECFGNEVWKACFFGQVGNGHCLSRAVGDNAWTLIEHSLQLFETQSGGVGGGNVLGVRRLRDQRDTGSGNGHDLDDPPDQLFQNALDRKICEHGAREVAQYI
jgi:hypothetical protein